MERLTVNIEALSNITLVGLINETELGARLESVLAYNGDIDGFEAPNASSLAALPVRLEPCDKASIQVFLYAEYQKECSLLARYLWDGESKPVEHSIVLQEGRGLTWSSEWSYSPWDFEDFD